MTGNPVIPLQLMRARYCAYAMNNVEYVLATYTSDVRKTLNLDALRQDEIRWVKLEILDHGEAHVEFVAYSVEDGQCYRLHERSRFVIEDRQWRYADGHILSDSGPFQWDRNAQCWCGSGKKFKKCCRT
ncbi:SEC-C domain-containing protein [Aestuariibacter halophilus]|uniref:SEC-C domain-containing protein n=1 Tax=Fluctibacter halophilus TaxID=226011 RepID=A0ABS8G6B6_9ALTE|nr:YchJ family metal-binding protein [Aestuariibacter halophilus]MCC2615641.1 SEC-C domain-containing protein [Aestuariibacter halophilus]